MGRWVPGQCLDLVGLGERRWSMMSNAWVDRSIHNSVFLVFWIGRFTALWIARKAEICIMPQIRVTRAMVVVPKGDGFGRADATRRSSESSAPENEKKSLNFKVSPEFKKEFKGFACPRGSA